ncbi:L,D-transpeptidase family protein [Ureibacillus sp. FSL K6-2830]|uniref:L,D-transpeptidase family protein n=1 Tax=Ureibacillus sp. FSL K6-2830 TaxID=2954610 RepID=UPI0030FC07FA
MIHYVRPGETLVQIARDYRIEYLVLLENNPQITNPDLLYIGQPINIPGLQDPSTIPYEIDISINNRTLSLYNNGILVKTYPIAVGRMLFETPTGNFVIVNRAPNPGGPFGTMWLTLSKESYGIHGTDDPSSIGYAVSRGCVRMLNADVEELASIVPNGTAVYIHY